MSVHWAIKLSCEPFCGKRLAIHPTSSTVGVHAGDPIRILLYNITPTLNPKLSQVPHAPHWLLAHTCATNRSEDMQPRWKRRTWSFTSSALYSPNPKMICDDAPAPSSSSWQGRMARVEVKWRLKGKL